MKIHSCSACTHDHDDIDPEKMEEAFMVNGVKFPYHFFCPDTGIEVLVRYDKVETVQIEQRAIDG